jgi:hypothetical protein
MPGDGVAHLFRRALLDLLGGARHGVSLRLADTNRINGWQRVHDLLQEVKDDGTGPVPALQVYGPGCPGLVRTLRNPGDVLQQADHWADALRYAAMSRPTGSRERKSDAWARFSPEVRKAIMGRGQGRLGTENVRRVA